MAKEKLHTEEREPQEEAAILHKATGFQIKHMFRKGKNVDESDRQKVGVGLKRRGKLNKKRAGLEDRLMGIHQGGLTIAWIWRKIPVLGPEL